MGTNLIRGLKGQRKFAVIKCVYKSVFMTDDGETQRLQRSLSFKHQKLYKVRSYILNSTKDLFSSSLGSDFENLKMAIRAAQA